MNTMKMTMKYFSMASLFIAGALMFSCSNENDIPDTDGQPEDSEQPEDGELPHEELPPEGDLDFDTDELNEFDDYEETPEQ